jgi:hypothetical protein
MTRRERHIRILDNFDGLRMVTGCRIVRSELDRLITRHGFELFTDKAIEMLTAATVRDWKRTQRMNRENRARRATIEMLTAKQVKAE